jgi:citrate synthase
LSTPDKLTFTLGDKSVDFGVVKATDGHDGVDISKLTSELGVVTYDSGFVNTSNTKSAITFIDGEQGILRHRGYPIEELAEKKTFLDLSHLLVRGDLPTASELDAFDHSIRRHTLVHENVIKFFSSFQSSAHPMSVLSAAVSVLSTYYNDSTDPKDPDQVELSTIRLLAKLPVLTAYTHKALKGETFIYPDNKLSLVQNFLKMTFGNPAEEYVQNPVLTKALDTLLLLHADHEQNCSTSTVRLVGSAQANMFASISSGISSPRSRIRDTSSDSVSF